MYNQLLQYYCQMSCSTDQGNEDNAVSTPATHPPVDKLKGNRIILYVGVQGHR